MVPARILFSLLGASAVVLGVVTGKPIFFVLVPLPLLFLATSLAASRLPLPRALGAFRNHVVEVRLWGAPPDAPGTPLILKSVNVIGVGLHLFFTASDGVTRHLKVAQPRDATLAPGHVTIAAARYVQWNATKLKPSDTLAAVSIALAGSSETELPGGED